MPPRYCRVPIGVILALSLLSVRGFAQDVEWQRVQDAEGRFTIDVPRTWIVDRTRSDRALATRSPEPPGTSPDTIDVWVHDAAMPVSPQNCGWQIAMVMRWTIHQWTTLEEGPSTLAGHPAFSRAYVWRLGGEERRSEQICVPVGRRVFVIIGTTANTRERIAGNLPTILRALDTFQPGAPPPGQPERGPGS
jgi:hypothetical protein